MDYTFYKVFHLQYYFAHRNVNSQFKNSLCQKAKADTRTLNSRPGARHWFITEKAVVTLETDYSCETGYPFDNSRQIGNTTQFENGMVLILNEQSAWLYPSILTDSLKMDYPFQIPCVQLPPPLRKNRRRGVCGGGGDCTQASLRRIIYF